MSKDIIDFMKYYKEKSNKKEDVVDFNKLGISEDQIVKMLSLFSITKYGVFLNCLFQNKNSLSYNNAGFMVGFKVEHLDYIEKKVCEVLKKIDRPFILVNANAKSNIKLSEELTNCYFKSMEEASIEMRRQFINNNKVYIIREFSKAKISAKGDHIRGLIQKREENRFIDGNHFEKIRPSSDLIFIDYANFLQKIWDQVGYYLSILTYSENENEFILDSE